jgi:hypothetical protein
MKTLLTMTTLLAIATGFATAEEGKPGKPGRPGGPGGPGGDGKGRPGPEQIIQRLDTDKDGSVSLEEFKAGPRAKQDPSKAEEMFKKLDTNTDGKISLEEFKAAPRPPRDGKGGPPKGGKEGAPTPPPAAQ